MRRHLVSGRRRGRAGLLGHLRVGVVADDLAARYAGRLAAQLGADVVLTRPDVDRWPSSAATAAIDAWLDQDVRLVDEVLATPGELDLVIAGQGRDTIAEAAHQWEQSGRAGTFVALGWFDERGPYAALPGGDDVVYALSGVAYSFGEAGGPPTIAGGHLPQVLGGLNAMIAGLGAIAFAPAARPRRVDVNVLEAMIALVEPTACARLDGLGTRPRRLGVNRFDPSYPTTSYRSADGWVGVSCLTPPQWAGLATLIGRSDLADAARFSTSRGRLAHADELDALIAPALARRTTASIVAEALARRLPICPMPRPGELPDHEHWRHRGSFAPLADHHDLRAPLLPYAIEQGRPPVVGPPAATDSSQPLAGLRVADFTMGWAGPYAARALADLGADVIKVEHARHPDWWRGWDGAETGDPPPIEVQTNFNAMNRGKRGVDFDLRDPAGLAAARALIASADIAIDNFAAGVLDRLGLGRHAQNELRPELINVSMPAFGGDGPLSGLRAYGTTVEQSSGLPFVNGRDGWPPCLHHVALGDPIAGMFGALAVLAAIAGRPHVGPAAIEITHVECLFQTAATAIISEQADDGHPPSRPSARSVEATDGDDRWLLVDRRSGDAVAIQRPDEMGDDPQHVATQLWGTLERRYVGVHAHVRQPFRFDGVRLPLGEPAPLLGQHTDEVLAELAVGQA